MTSSKSPAEQHWPVLTHRITLPKRALPFAAHPVQGLGFDMLVVCGRLRPARCRGGQTLRQTDGFTHEDEPGSSDGRRTPKKDRYRQLFMVFGEPDVEIRKQKRRDIVVEIRGVDVYDPTTGQIRSTSTDDIACWFIDTDYNGESFFARHAYFTGAEEPYDQLKRALRADIDEGAWSSLYSTVSRPFGKPESGKIAIKVINHFGDEVLKVIEI